MKKTLLGLGLIALALYLLYPQALPIWTTIGLILFGGDSLTKLIKGQWLSAIYSGFFTLAIANSHFQWLSISFWKLCLIGFLIAQGLSLIFGHRPFFINFQSNISKTSNGKQSSVSFGSEKRYISDQVFSSSAIEVAFADYSLYFEESTLLNPSARLNLELAFSTMTVYIPKHWKVDIQADQVFSKIKNQPLDTQSDQILLITGDIAWSHLTVIYF